MIQENGYIKCDGSSGYQNNSIEYYRLGKNATLEIADSAEQIEGVFYETTQGKQQLITEEEYLAFDNKYPEGKNLDWIRID